MTEYAAQLSKRALTQDEIAVAEQAIRGARESGQRVTRQTVRKVFPPGVDDLVMRYLRGV